ncbi:hypothetical protein GQX74_009489 [Glossina fuscipes]|nr:hypothetical protein GQX74_009489 [Glossina fuscipes]
MAGSQTGKKLRAARGIKEFFNTSCISYLNHGYELWEKVMLQSALTVFVVTISLLYMLKAINQSMNIMDNVCQRPFVLFNGIQPSIAKRNQCSMLTLNLLRNIVSSRPFRDFVKAGTST